MKLSDWAKKQGIAYLTAYRWFKDGKLPVKAYQSDSGTIIVQDDSETSEQSMVGNGTQNDAMSLFLKKTVEYSKNNSTVEDFAAYVLSNFQLKLSSANESPKYSRNKPKAEDIQKHFQQFIKKGDKPKPEIFVIEPEKLDELAAQSDGLTTKDLVDEIKSLADHEGYTETEIVSQPETQDLIKDLSAVFTTGTAVQTAINSSVKLYGTTPTEGMVTRSVDLNTTPQQINYTGSTNHAFSSSSNSSVISGDVATASYLAATPEASPALYFNNSFQPTAKELQGANKVIETAETEQPRRRGRKPSKNKR